MVYVIVTWPQHTRTSYTEFDLENELLWYVRNLSHLRTLSLRCAAVELAVEGRLRAAALAQHLADRNATGGSQGPGGKTTP